MVAIRHNKATTLDINYVNEHGGIATISLMPGVTIGVDDAAWEQAKNHPIVKILLEEGTIEPLTHDPVITKELDVHEEGHDAAYEVVEDKESGQPMPVTPAKKTTKKTS